MSQAITDRLNALPEGNSKQVLNAISKMTVLELAQFKKDFETVFEVQAAAAVAVAAPGAAAGGGGEAKAEAKTSFDVILTAAGDCLHAAPRDAASGLVLDLYEEGASGLRYETLGWGRYLSILEQSVAKLYPNKLVASARRVST